MEPETFRSRVAAQSAPLRVSAVVVVGDCVRSLDMCLHGILNEPLIDELILVDSGASRAVAKGLRGLQADRRDVRWLQAKGAAPTHAAARNLGAERARGRFLLFVDADVAVQPGAVERLVKAGRLAKSPWIVGGGLSDPSGRRVGLRQDGLTGRRPTPVDLIDEAFLLVPRAAFLALGGFDESYVLHGETADLCKRARQSGGAVWLQPVAEAVQFTGVRAASPIADQVQRARAKARFARKFARTEFDRVMVSLWAPLLEAAGAVRGALKAPLRPPSR